MIDLFDLDPCVGTMVKIIEVIGIENALLCMANF